ncbi:MAG: acetylxylan esterase [Nitrospiraceae bacterium]|nr:acetylxylan esterase [Nitrospiraceae bacterium]
MRRQTVSRLCIGLLLCITCWTPQAISAGACDIGVSANRRDAMYRIGEEVTFRASVMVSGRPADAGKIDYVLSNDGVITLDEGSAPLTGEPVLITGKLDHPGFLRCKVTYTDKAGKAHSALAAGAFEPLKIKPSLPVPDDFVAFWKGKKAELAKIPMKPELKPLKSPDRRVACFDVQIPCLGDAPVSGYYARPLSPRLKSCPAVLWFHGGGVIGARLRASDAAQGMLVLDINAHGIPNGKPDAYYRDLARGRLNAYEYAGRESRETCYFLGMYLRALRAIDFLTVQPEWDGKVLVARGSSQGGGQAIVAAGLDSRVTAVIANVPAMCEQTGEVCGWPRLVPRDESGAPNAEIREVARYFDVMNFATLTKADALVSVGFIDRTCLPTTVYAAYNNLRGDKRIVNGPRMGHGHPDGWNRLTRDWIQQHIRASQRLQR